MKKLLCVLFLLITEAAIAGQVGGSGGGLALTDEGSLLDSPFTLTQKVPSIREIGTVFTGAKNLSRETFGDEQLFTIDVKNRVVTFDAERTVLDESAVLSFDEVKRFADPSELKANEDILGE